MPFEKYRPYPALELPDRTWPDKRHESAPNWSSLALRAAVRVALEATRA